MKSDKIWKFNCSNCSCKYISEKASTHECPRCDHVNHSMEIVIILDDVKKPEHLATEERTAEEHTTEEHTIEEHITEENTEEYPGE